MTILNFRGRFTACFISLVLCGTFVSNAKELIYNFPMDTDPGWTTEGDWEFGVPQGNAGDPSSGFTGTNVYGYNLAGAYTNFNAPHFLSTPAFDCSDYVDVELRFKRWLTVDGSEFPMAAVQVSDDGIEWPTPFFYNSSEPLIDTEWQDMTLDISGQADRSSVVYIRWAMGSHTPVITNGGWNIDDVELWGNPADPLDVLPEDEWDAVAIQGYQPDPASQIYVVTNRNSLTSLTWSATTTASWLTLDVTNGVLQADESTNVLVSIDSTGLVPGSYSAEIHINNSGTTNSQVREVNLEIQDIPGAVIVEPLSGYMVTNLIGQYQERAFSVSNAAPSGSVEFWLDIRQTGFEETVPPMAPPAPAMMASSTFGGGGTPDVIETYTLLDPTVKTEGEYDLIYIQGSETYHRTGSPIVPVKPVRINIPAGSTVQDIRVEVIEENVLQGSYLLAPGQEIYPLEADNLERAETQPDPEIYEQAENWPGISGETVGIYEDREGEFAIINLFPVQFNPVLGSVTHATKMSVHVEFEEPAPFAAQSFQSMSTSSLPSGGPFKHVIITSSSFASEAGPWNFQALRDMRTAEGLPSTIITTEWIFSTYDGTRPDGGSDNQTKIRNFLIDAYENWGTEYALLGGASDLIPARMFWVDAMRPDYPTESIGSIPADMYYGCVSPAACTFDEDGDGNYGEVTDGVGGGDVDLVAEIYVGRAPIEDSTELSNFVRKTIKYAEWSDETARLNVSMLGERIGFGGPAEYSKDMLEQVRLGGEYDGYFTRGFENHGRNDLPPLNTSVNLYEKDASRWYHEEMAELINSNNVHILNWIGHANITHDMNMNTDTISNLANTNYPFLYSQSCDPAAFDHDDCFGEEIVVMEHGVFATIMNPRYAWEVSNSSYCPFSRLNRLFWDTVFSDGHFELGVANQKSREKLIWDINGPAIRWQFYEQTLLGDPAQRLNFPYETGWLTADPEAAEGITPSNAVNVNIGFDAGGAVSGSYTGEISIISNDELNPVQVMPAVMVVLADDLSITPEWGMNLSGNQGVLPVPQTTVYSLTNSGSGSLDWEAVNPVSWLDVSPSNGTLAAYGQTNLSITINTNANAYPGGSYTTAVAVSNLSSGAVFTREVQLNIGGGTTNDIISPSCVIGRDDANPSGASVVNFSIDFSEEVTGFEQTDVDLTGTAPGMNITGFSGTGSNYTVTVGGISGTGTVVLDVDAGKCADAAGNSNTAASAVSYDMDLTGPVITSITSTSSNGIYGVGEDVDITLTFSEVVDLDGSNLVVTLETGDTDRDVVIDSIDFEDEVSITYTVQTGDKASDLSVSSFTLNGATLRDAVGNDAALDLPVGQNLDDTADIVIDTSYSIIAGISGNGTIDPLGSVSVEHLESTNFLIQAAANHHIASIKTNGVDVAGSPFFANDFAGTNYVWNNITSTGTITAAFEINQHTLLVESAHGGANPGTLSADWGTLLDLSVTNSPLSVGVSTQHVCVAGTVLSNDYAPVSPTNVMLTLTNDAVLTWLWQTEYMLETATNGNGMVSAATVWHASGSEAVLTASPSEHSHFTHWSGDTNGCAIVGNVITAAMTQARSITAHFDVDEYTLTVESEYGGTDVGTVAADWGTVLDLYVTNSPFSIGDGTQQVCMAGTVLSNAYTQVSPTNIMLTLTNDAVLTWQWQTEFYLAALAGTNGQVEATNGWYAAGTTNVVTAIPNPDHTFLEWSGSVKSADNPLILVMSNAYTVAANFVYDRDLDGIPDWWESYYFGGPTNAVASGMASNGINTVLESYISGLDPTDPAARFMLYGHWNELWWNGISGRVYGVWASTNLVDGFHPVETNIPWTVGGYTDEVNAVESQLFYKLDVNME